MSSKDAVGRAERSLLALRNRYQMAEADLISTAADKSLAAQQANWIGGALTILLFLGYVILVRNWLVRPIEVFKSAADAIGEGTQDGRIPLTGHDELAQLARRLETMTARLAAQQTALLKARELSAIGELCTSVAYGLRNPLAAMRGCAQADMLDGATPEQLEVILRDLMRQVDRMEERVTRLFEFSQWKELRPERATFHQIALTAQAHVGPLLQERDVQLTIDDRSGDMVSLLDRDEFGFESTD